MKKAKRVKSANSAYTLIRLIHHIFSTHFTNKVMSVIFQVNFLAHRRRNVPFSPFQTTFSPFNLLTAINTCSIYIFYSILFSPFSSCGRRNHLVHCILLFLSTCKFFAKHRKKHKIHPPNLRNTHALLDGKTPLSHDHLASYNNNNHIHICICVSAFHSHTFTCSLFNSTHPIPLSLHLHFRLFCK